MLQLLDDLNEEQRTAVTFEGGPLIVLAGPGTGKTRVITRRVARLLDDGREPESILALTFTNKAAEEMRRRIAELVGSSSRADRIRATTFHSFGLYLIRRFADMVGWTAEPRIIDSGQARALMRRLIDETGIGALRHLHDPHALVPGALRFMGEAKDHALFPIDIARHVDDRRARFESGGAKALDSEARLAEAALIERLDDFGRLYRLFDDELLRLGWATFDELQSRPLRMLRDNERIRAILRTELRSIVVDEFQDVNTAQIELLKELAPTTGDLCVVGDDDQSIYAFRGAQQWAFRRFAEHWDSTTIELSKNYRSTPIILNAANVIIEKCDDRFQPDKRTIAAGEFADLDLPLEGVTYADTGGAGPAIGRLILKAVNSDGRSYRDFAVLTRTHTDLDRLRAALDLIGVPTETPETPDDFSHPAVVDLMSWLRLLDDPGDVAHVLRVLARPPYRIPLATLSDWLRESAMIAADARDAGDEIEETRPALERFIEWRRDDTIERFARQYEALRQLALTQPIDQLVRAVIHRSGALTLDPIGTEAHRERIERVGRFIAFVTDRTGYIDPPGRLRQFLRYYDELSPAERGGRSAEERLDMSGPDFSDRDAVRLLTAHGSKGLEFDTVFIPRLNPRYGYPYTYNGRTTEEIGLPEELTGPEQVSELNEERRLFFVAMTRARRRLVLLTQIRSGARRCSPSEFWSCLFDPPCDGAPVRVMDASAADDDVDSLDGLAVVGAPRGQVVRLRERLEARREVYAALHELNDSELDPSMISGALRRIIAAASRLPVLAAPDKDRIPAIIDGCPAEWRDDLLQYAEKIETLEPARPSIPGPKPPLTLSYSQIAAYNRCPRCYWLANVVGARDGGNAATSFGSIIHRTLEFFYKRVRDADAEGAARPTLDHLLEIGRQSYRDLRDANLENTKQFMQRIEAALRQFHEKLHDDRCNPVELERTIVFDYPLDNHTHRIIARIDRIDFDDRHHVIDYKAGKPKKQYVEPDKRDLQMGIYLMALRSFLEDDSVEGTAEYWLISTAEKGILDFADIKLAKVRDEVNKAIRGIINSDWRPTENCEYCELLGTINADDDD